MLGEYQQQFKKLEQQDPWGPGWKEMSSWKCIMSVWGEDGKTKQAQTCNNVQLILKRAIIWGTSRKPYRAKILGCLRAQVYIYIYTYNAYTCARTYIHIYLFIYIGNELLSLPRQVDLKAAARNILQRICEAYCKWWMKCSARWLEGRGLVKWWEWMKTAQKYN